MGATQTSNQYSFLYTDWLFLHRNHNYDIYKQLKTNQEVEVYSVKHLSVHDIKIYEKRKLYNHPNIIKLLHYEIISQKQRFLCGQDTFAKVILQRTQCSIRKYTKFNRKSIHDIMSETLLGFQAIFLNFGTFTVEQQMIRFNKNGTIKVWLNSNFSNNYPQLNMPGNLNQQKIVSSILIFLNEIFGGLQYEIKKKITFIDALKIIQRKNSFEQRKISTNFIQNQKLPKKQISNINAHIIPNPFNNVILSYPVNSSPINNKKNASFPYPYPIKSPTTPSNLINNHLTNRPLSYVPQGHISHIHILPSQKNIQSTNFIPLNQKYPVVKFTHDNLNISQNTANNQHRIPIIIPTINTSYSNNSKRNIGSPPHKSKQIKLNNESISNSFTYKKQMSSHIMAPERREQVYQLELQQTPRLGVNIKAYQSQPKYINSNLKKRINTIQSKQFNSQHNSRNISPRLITCQINIQEIKKIFLNSKKSNFEKLDQIEMILKNNGNQEIRRICILFKHALTIDLELYQELMRSQCKFQLIQNQIILQRLKNILNQQKTFNDTFKQKSNIKKNNQINKNNEIQYEEGQNENKLIIPSRNFRRSSVKRVQSREQLVNNIKKNIKLNKQNKQEEKRNIINKSKIIKGQIEQVMSISGSNNEQDEQKTNGHKRNKSQTQTLIPIEKIQNKQRMKRINTENDEKKRQKNNDKLVINVENRIKQILACQREKRLMRQQYKQMYNNILKEQKLFINKNQYQDVINKIPDQIIKEQNIENTPKKQFQMLSLKSFQKISQMEKPNNQNNILKNPPSQLQNIYNKLNPNYHDLNIDRVKQMQNQSRMMQKQKKLHSLGLGNEDRAIQEKIKKKKNNFANLKKQVAQVLGIF